MLAREATKADIQAVRDRLFLNAASSGGSESLTEIFKMASRRC